MKNLLSSKFALALLLGSALTGTLVQANTLPIDGQINFAGEVVGNAGPNLIDATSLLIPSANVFYTVGTYASNLQDPSGVPFFTPVTFASPISITQATPFQLWSFNVGGVIYSFEATSISSQTTGSIGTTQSLALSGSGIASISGGVYGPTDGTWSISITKAGTQTSDVFSFGSDNFVVGPQLVPDTGATALLFALGLGALALVLKTERKRAAL